MKHLIVFALAATLCYLIYTEGGITPVSEVDSQQYATMGYLMALFAGLGTGLAKAIRYEFGWGTTSGFLGCMFGLGFTNLIGIALFGTVWQVLISFIPFTIAMLLTMRFSNYYIDTMAGFKA